MVCGTSIRTAVGPCAMCSTGGSFEPTRWFEEEADVEGCVVCCNSSASCTLTRSIGSIFSAMFSAKGNKALLNVAAKAFCIAPDQ